MVCKVEKPDIETDDLTWQPLGSSVTGPTVQRSVPAVVADNSRARDAAASQSDTRTAGGVEGLDIAGLRQRVTELEAQRAAELEQARKAAFEQGVRQGRQEAAAEMESALDRLARTIQEVAQVKRKVRTEAENELVKLSLAIARRILHREVTADPQSLRGVVYAALQRLQNREITRIRVFPAAVPSVRAALERNGGMAAIEIMPDGLLPPGGLLFETSLGDLDASVETQLQEIERGFADKLQLR
jgi:flagellar assembly protein FliH